METKKKIFVTQNIAEPMWIRLAKEVRSGSMKYDYYEDNLDALKEEAQEENTEVINIINNKALLNEVNKRTGLGLVLNTSLRAEVKKSDAETFVIYSISVTNLTDLYKFEKSEELPAGVNLQALRYKF